MAGDFISDAQESFHDTDMDDVASTVVHQVDVEFGALVVDLTKRNNI